MPRTAVTLEEFYREIELRSVAEAERDRLYELLRRVKISLYVEPVRHVMLIQAIDDALAEKESNG